MATQNVGYFEYFNKDEGTHDSYLIICKMHFSMQNGAIKSRLIHLCIKAYYPQGLLRHRPRTANFEKRQNEQ